MPAGAGAASQWVPAPLTTHEQREHLRQTSERSQTASGSTVITRRSPHDLRVTKPSYLVGLAFCCLPNRPGKGDRQHLRSAPRNEITSESPVPDGCRRQSFGSRMPKSTLPRLFFTTCGAMARRIADAESDDGWMRLPMWALTCADDLFGSRSLHGGHDVRRQAGLQWVRIPRRSCSPLPTGGRQP